MNDRKIEELLHIKTSGRDDTRADSMNYPYEPTDYMVLERLAKSGLIGKRNLLIDYGSGKGRVAFYLTFETGCRSVGIELDERLYNRACGNLNTYSKKDKVSFVNENAVKYTVPKEADRFFFFNPFSDVILAAVLAQIKKSIYSDDNEYKERLFFFYYPSDEYISVLMSEESLCFYDEIDCSDLFPNSKEAGRERIVIFSCV